MALDPGMDEIWGRGLKQKSDFYHVSCFEEIADLSNVEYFKRINAVTRLNFHVRGLKANNVMDGMYLCDGGAERLITDWTLRRGGWVNDQAGISNEPENTPFNRAFWNLWNRAGSSSFKFEPVEGLGWHETFLLHNMLAPFQSDGPADTEEWNLFDEYLPNDVDDLNQRHSLSRMLATWTRDQGLACTENEHLTAAEIEAKHALSDKAIKAIRRLSSVPMPNFQ